ncbi:MAG: rod shape-determining protein RodA [Halothiobacillaceae bacterium]|jgi:rod shape determining protein RodA|nr:rod shape-determining protein RodA [Halothiobacillaceae bacterium]MDY0049249.1 rod shape-determining protein RodA [Halothiobacillaceae bacterium]
MRRGSLDTRAGWLTRWLRLDPFMLFLLLLVTLIGLGVGYSASGASVEQLTRQGIRYGLAFALMLAVAYVPPRFLRAWAPWFYGVGLLLLIAVDVAGEIGKGAQRWLDLGVVRFQPSELMKLAVPMMVAWYLADRPTPPRLLDVFVALLLIGVPMVLVMIQPDLGTALLVGSAGFFVLFLAGLPWRMLFGFALMAAAAVPVMWSYVMHDYQRQRVLTLFDPERDPLGTGYHIIQSKIAIGSGGLYGKGWLQGTQAHLDFLPEGTTDFILAVFAEEFGLMGVAVLLALYLLIILRGLFVATQAASSFGRLLAGAIGLTFFVYVFVNAGMVAGLLPVVGVPLPLVSYGGTSLVTLMIGFGILMSIHSHRGILGRAH